MVYYCVTNGRAADAYHTRSGTVLVVGRDSVGMVNEQYEPDAVEDRVIELLREEGRVNAPLVVKRTELSRADVNHALRNLATAGWCQKLARGLYEYVEDPRVSEGDERSQRAETRRETGAMSRARTPAVDVGQALAEWDPQDVDSRKARAAVAEVVGWLAAQDAPQQRADVLAWAEANPAATPYAASTLWEKVAQPGLAELQQQGLVERTANVGYEIVENSDGEA